MKKNHKLLVGDIGGTNCRLATCDPVNGEISEITIFPVEELDSLEQALNTYRAAKPEHSFLQAAISIANPITGDQIAMTNAHWDFSIERTRQNCQLDRLVMLNDWESVALSLPSFKHQTLSKLIIGVVTNSVIAPCAESERVLGRLDWSEAIIQIGCQSLGRVGTPLSRHSTKRR